MRCLYCGLDNPSGVSKCTRCGQPLDAVSTMVNPNGGERSNIQEGKPTVRDVNMAMSESRTTQAYQPDMEINRKTVKQVVTKCPHCGYPVIGEYSACPNCGSPLSAKEEVESDVTEKDSDRKNYIVPQIETEVCDECGAEIKSDDVFCPKCGAKIRHKTQRIKREHSANTKSNPKCSLKLVLEEDENIEAQKNIYEGASVVLSRANTEPENRTITSKEQALLIHEDGHWYIENRATCNPTFVMAERRLELLPGDKILLGDRIFVFDQE